MNVAILASRIVVQQKLRRLLTAWKARAKVVGMQSMYLAHTRPDISMTCGMEEAVLHKCIAELEAALR